MKGKLLSAILAIAILLPVFPNGGRIPGMAVAAGLNESKLSLNQAATSAIGPVGQNSDLWTMTFSDEFSGVSLDRAK